MHNLWHETPVLAPPELVTIVLVRLRAAEDCNGLTNRGANAKYANSANAAARRHSMHLRRSLHCSAVASASIIMGCGRQMQTEFNLEL